MNEADVAEQQESVIMEKRIKAIRSRTKTRRLAPKGSCHYCDEPFPKGDHRIFCDSDCRDDNQKYNK